MKLTPPQKQISSCPARFRVVAAGRRFGKSFLAINELAKFARHPNQKTLYCAPTYRQAKTVIWDDLKSMLIEKRWVKKINESELQVTLINGSTITVRSTDNYDALRGGKYDFIVLDEFADCDPEAWFSVLRPTLSDRQGHALFIGSPKGRNHFWEIFTQAKELDDWAAFQYTTIQGGNVPPEEIEAARRDLDERTFRAEYEAEFNTISNQIFYAFSENNVVKHPGFPDERTPIHIAMDFNVSPITAICATKTANTLHVFDEIEIWGSNTNEMCAEIRNRYGFDRQIYVYPDASGARKQTSSGGVSDHIIIMNAGFKLKTGTVNPSVKDSITSVNSMFKNTLGEHRLFIDPKCRRLRECVLKWTFKEGTRIPDKDSGYDHFSDCLRYLVHGIFPFRQEFNNTKKSFRRI